MISFNDDEIKTQETTSKGGLSGVEVEPELVAKHIGNCGWN